MELAKLNLNERMQHNHVIGSSISTIRNGEISKAEPYGLLEAGTNRIVKNESQFSACSISKFVTSMLVMLLSDQGIVDLDEDINRKLVSWQMPNHEYTKEKPVTLRNLLSHQSGIVDPEGSFRELNSKDGIPSMVNLLNGKTSYCKESIRISYEPGSDFHYSDAGFCVIQLLIEDVTGVTFEEIAHELILQPLGMNSSTLTLTFSEENKNSFSCGHTKNGKVIGGKFPINPYPAAAGLWSTPSDLANLVIELMNALKGKSKIGLSVSKAKEMITPQGSKGFAGLGVFLDGSGREIEISSLGWGAGFQCMLLAYPYQESGFIIMTNTDMGVHQMKGLIGEVYHSFAASIRYN